MQKYIKLTQEDFCKTCEISHRVRNEIFTVLLFVLQLVLLLAFRIGCEMKLLDVRFLPDSLILFLAYLIDLAKATKLSKTWILHVFELQLALLWTIQNSPPFLARFNDQKAIKNTKTCQKLIRNIFKGL